LFFVRQRAYKNQNEESCYKSAFVPAKRQKIVLIKVEGAYEKHYRLLLDIALNAMLEDLDDFLRRIWLECCGHMSGFYPPADNWGRGEFGMYTKINRFAAGEKLLYRYDFGSTTTLLITVLADGLRPPQKDKVRLLARNVAPKIVCVNCGKPAECCCPICDYDHRMYCKECYKIHYRSHKESPLPITNSPRNCVCGYDGELDVWKFDPSQIPHS
jgi:hypothetical protein